MLIKSGLGRKYRFPGHRREVEETAPWSVPALLVSIGAPRLRRIGLAVEHPIDAPERRLYERLQAENPDAAHSRFNALVRRLVSFERAAECVK